MARSTCGLRTPADALRSSEARRRAARRTGVLRAAQIASSLLMPRAPPLGGRTPRQAPFSRWAPAGGQAMRPPGGVRALLGQGAMRHAFVPVIAFAALGASAAPRRGVEVRVPG